VGQAILPCSRLSEAAEKVRKRQIEPPINADERRQDNCFQSAFIRVHRRPTMTLAFFSSLFQAALSDMRESSIPASAG
jgi:hypothetical protein